MPAENHTELKILKENYKLRISKIETESKEIVAYDILSTTISKEGMKHQSILHQKIYTSINQPTSINST